MGRSPFVIAITLAMVSCAREAPRRASPSVRHVRPVTAIAAPVVAPPPAPVRVPVDAPAPPTPPDPNDTITIAAVGDLMLARTIGERLEASPPQSPFAAVAPILREADVAIGNLECNIGLTGAPIRKAFNFRAPPVAANALVEAGIDVVSIANNHAMDFGAESLGETIEHLDRNKIVHAGGGLNEADAHRPGLFEVRGHKLAFLAYVKVPVEGMVGFDTNAWTAKGDVPGLAWADPARIAADVAAAKATADHVIVMMHSGFEGDSRPNIWQTMAAEAAIDAGAVLVVGAHPHVLQGARRYKKGFIAYSLGNFVFDRTDIVSAILKVTIDASGVKDVAWVPVILRGGFPQLTDDQTGTYVKNLLKGLSMPLGG